jgi:thioredoxin-related protein
VSTLTQRYQGKVRVIHINVDDPAATPFLKKYNVRGTPTIVLIDRHGQITANVPGWPGDQEVAQALDSLVGEQ